MKKTIKLITGILALMLCIGCGTEFDTELVDEMDIPMSEELSNNFHRGGCKHKEIEGKFVGCCIVNVESPGSCGIENHGIGCSVATTGEVR